MANTKNHTPLVRYLATESYLMTRGAALHFPAKQFSKLITPEHSVYGVVIDIPMNPTTLATLVVYINGAANLYFNMYDGEHMGCYTGASQRYQSVVQAGQILVTNASRMLGDAQKTKQFDLPMGRNNNIFLLTRNGIYKKPVSPTEVANESKEVQSVYFLYQRVMQELHSAQMKDRAAAQKNQ